MPIVELAKRTGLAKTTLTSMLDRMESQGHVVRCCDTKDRRQIRIRLTEQAQKLEEKYGQVSDEMSRLFYRGFADEEIKALENGLGKILRNLEAEESQAYKSSK